jgi:hypothetical protein
LPFADEIAKLTRGFSKITDEAGDDLRDIFDLTEGRGGPDQQARSRDVDSSRGARGFLVSAISAVQDHLENNNAGGKGQDFEIGGLLGVLSSTLKDTSRDPEEKARFISPEIKEKVGEKLRMQHAPIAEQFTRIALDHIKRWLRGNTSTRDLGDGAKAEIEDQVKDLVKGLGVHRAVRLEFRRVLGEIEKQLFELLPDQFQRPLEKILGGNPFDSQLDRDATGQADRGFGDDIKAKLLNKIRALVKKVQETLRESIMGVVNGGHRKFERESWVFVQNMVEQKVQRYLPDVKIIVPDDIGNEGVGVGAPTSGAQIGGGNKPWPSPGDSDPAPSHGDHRGGQGHAQHGYTTSQQYQDNQYRNEPSQQYQDNQYRNEPYQRSEQYQPPQQDHHPQQTFPSQGYSQQDHHPQQTFSSQGYPQQSYPPGDYPPQNYQQQY